MADDTVVDARSIGTMVAMSTPSPSVGPADHPLVAALARAFRYVAFGEALSWLGLLIGMAFKYLVEPGTEVGVQFFGPVHGALFMLYVVVTLAAAMHFRWTRTVTVVALLAAIPPFATAVFEIWASRAGLLVRPAKASASA